MLQYAENRAAADVETQDMPFIAVFLVLGISKRAYDMEADNVI